MAIIVTIIGFVFAGILNLVFPQVADVTITDYVFFHVSVNRNIAYLVLICFAIIYYASTGFFAMKEEKKWKSYRKLSYRRCVFGVLLAIWNMLGDKLELLPQPFFPGPCNILEAFLMEPAYIFENTVYSFRLFAAGFCIGVFVGVGTGILIGWFPRVNYWISPILNFSGIIPAVAWMPFALILFPTSFAAAVFLIVVCSWFPVASMTAIGIAGTPKGQFEAAKTLGAKTCSLIFHVAVPYAMPQIFIGITTAEAFSFTTLVMAEMMGQPGGLGYYINASKVWSAYYKVFAAIIVMAILFGLISKGITAIQNRVLRWQRGIVR